MKSVAYITGLILLSVLCSCQNDDQNENEIDIIGHAWRLSSIVYSKGLNVDVRSLSSPQDEYWIVFDDNGGITATDACNACSGEYEFGDDGTILISAFSCTEMACSGSPYLFPFDGHYSYVLNGEGLILIENSPQLGSQYTFIAESE